MMELDAFASATALIQALNGRCISSRELVEMYLQRIRRYNPILNAIVVIDEQSARQSTRKADERRSNGEIGALLGLPVTIKESLDVVGLPGTVGVQRFAQRRAKTDARIVERAKAAGAVILGKTNVPPYLSDWQTNNTIYGRTNNPWNLNYTPGGSTGGGAAALAAGLTPMEFGSDIAGSIRIPAAFCGLTAHKPSETALPRSGNFPGSSLPNVASVMGVQGLMTRYACDLELAFTAVAGPDVGEDTAWNLRIPAPRHEHLVDVKVGVLPRLSWLTVEPEILTAQENLIRRLQRLGIRVQEIKPVGFQDFRDYYCLYLHFLFAMKGSRISKEERLAEAEHFRAQSQDDEFTKAIVEGLEASASDFLRWHARRETYRAAWRELFRKWDVVLAPVNITPAFPHTDVPMHERYLEIDGQKVPYTRQNSYSAIATLCGQPATAFPAGLTHDGLPIGLQVIGPYLEDLMTITFADLVTREFGEFQRPPGYDDN